MSQLGGGLRWSGVSGGNASSASSRIMSQAKAARQKEAMSAPKVGSACVVEADDWLAAAAANQEIRERQGRTTNPFESAEELVREAKRQAVDDDEVVVPKKPRGDDAAAAAAAAEEEEEDDDDDDDDELPPGLGGATGTEAAAAGTEATAAAADLSREQKREIELSVFELRDELEEEEDLDEAAVDAQCDALRAKLTERALAAA